MACDGGRGGVGVNADPAAEHDEDAGAYCRAIEAHLCRKNDGHLIRISGPAFDLVRGWAEQGIPLRVATSGIDRTFERYYAKGPRRRPVHITFCEADVLEAFDAWRRATGVVTARHTAVRSAPFLVASCTSRSPHRAVDHAACECWAEFAAGPRARRVCPGARRTASTGGPRSRRCAGGDRQPSGFTRCRATDDRAHARLRCGAYCRRA